MNPKTVFSKEVKPVGRGLLLNAPIDDLPLSDQIPTYAGLKRLAKLIEARMKTFKPGLMAQAAAHGTKNEKGSFSYEVDGSKITKQHRQDTVPDLEKLRSLLQTKGIPIDDCFVPVEVLELSPTKLDHLIQLGKLDREEVQALCTETWACLLDESPELAALLDEVCSPAPKEEEEPPRAAKKRSLKR